MPTYYQVCYATDDEVKAECRQKSAKYPLQATTTWQHSLPEKTESNPESADRSLRFLPLLVFAVRTFVEDHFRIAFEGEDVRGDTIEEPAAITFSALIC